MKTEYDKQWATEKALKNKQAELEAKYTEQMQLWMACAEVDSEIHQLTAIVEALGDQIAQLPEAL